MRKWIATCACVALVAVLAAGCGGSSSKSNAGTSVDPNKKVTLTMWDWSVPDPAAVKKIDDAYMAAHPNVTIKRVHEPAGDPYYTLLHSAMAARKGPDVFYTFSGRFILDFLNGTRQLDDLMKPTDEARLKGWKEAAAVSGGKHYVIPIDGNGSILYYNKALFRKAGLDPEAPPTTFDELLTTCDKLKAAGITPLAGGFKDGGMGELMVANWVAQYMSPEELTQSEQLTDWTNPAFGKAFALVQQLYKHGCFTPHSEALNLFPDVINYFKAGKAAISLGLVAADAHWQIFRQTSWGKKNLGTMLFPLVPGSTWTKQQVQYGPTSALAITKWTKNPAVAYDYIQFYTSAANQEQLFTDSGTFPNNVDAKPNATDPVAAQILGWIHDNGTFLGPFGVIQANVEAALLRYVPQIVTGKTTYDAIAGQIEAEQEKDK